MKLHFTLIILLTISVSTLPSCKKYLAAKSDQSLSTPSTLDDLQQILDNPQLSTGLIMDNTATDEIYLDEAMWQSMPELYADGYVWKSELNDFDDWNSQYNAVFIANTALLNLQSILSPEEARKEKLKGSALFIRALAFYQIAQLYALQYDPSSANTDLGIPLRLTADFNEKSVRSTLAQTYDRILQDLNEAADLLPATVIQKFRPSKLACLGLMARVYLQMGDFSKAKQSADKYLSIRNELIDYNTIDPNAQHYPFGSYKENPEVAYYVTSVGLSAFEGLAKIDSNLYNSYLSSDTRKQLFFLDNGDGSFSFKGKYSGEFYLFTGIATDEIYLIRAESNARLNNVSAALDDLNHLAEKRYDRTIFSPFSASTAQQALSIILEERRKQLVTRGTRWSDLKRLNKEAAYATTLKRSIGASEYQLLPNNSRYALLIPREVLNRVDLPQNRR